MSDITHGLTMQEYCTRLNRDPKWYAEQIGRARIAFIELLLEADDIDIYKVRREIFGQGFFSHALVSRALGDLFRSRAVQLNYKTLHISIVQ